MVSPLSDRRPHDADPWRRPLTPQQRLADHDTWKSERTFNVLPMTDRIPNLSRWPSGECDRNIMDFWSPEKPQERPEGDTKRPRPLESLTAVISVNENARPSMRDRQMLVELKDDRDRTPSSPYNGWSAGDEVSRLTTLCDDRIPRPETTMLSDGGSRSMANEMSYDGSHEDADRWSKYDSQTDSWLNETELTVNQRRPCSSKRPVLADRDAVDTRYSDEAEETHRGSTTDADLYNERPRTTDWRENIVTAE